MPKIPHQAQRTVLPSGGTGTGASANARGIAGKVTGIQAFGAALTGGAEQLGAAFQHAAHERDKIEAHMRSLEAKTGSQKIALKAEMTQRADREDFTEQLRKQGANNPESWRLGWENEHGERVEFGPKEGIEKRMTQRYDEALKEARAQYGPEGEMQVAEMLKNETLNNVSKFRSDHLQLRYDKLKADVAENEEFYATRAADITAPEALRKSNIQMMDQLTESSVRQGTRTKEEAEKRQKALHADIAHKFYSATAAAAPVKFLEDSKAWTAQAEPGEGELTGGATITGKTKGLPEGMDPAKLDEYIKIARGSVTAELEKVDRVERAYTARAEADSLRTYNEVIGVSFQKDNSLEIEQKKDILGKRYDEAVKANREWNNARRTEITQATIDASQFTQFELENQARMAKYRPELLSETNPRAITNSVVRQHVVGQKDLLPEHAGKILGLINEAIAYQTQEDSGKRQAEQAGMKVLDKLFFAPERLNPSDAFELQRLKVAADAQLASDYEKNPTADRNELALTLGAKFLPRVLMVQKASMDSLERQLNTMQEAWPKGFASPKHELNEGQRKQMEQNNPALRGLFKVYDATVTRLNSLIKDGERTAQYAEQEAYAK